MSFKSYLISKPFWKNIALAIAITIVLLLVTMFAIRVYTNHGESFAVPDFSGMGMDEVKQLAGQKNLNLEITDSLYLNNVAPGTVIDQVPVGGFVVKEGRTIFLTICAFNPEQVAMPKLTDISFRQALNLIRSLGLNVGEVSYVPSEFSSLVLKQMINGEEIETGILVNKGSTIDLVVGENTRGEKTFLPNLLGVTLEQAELVVAESKLNVGAVIYDESCATYEDSIKARIWQQRPEADDKQKVDQGSAVDLWLSVDEDKFQKID